MRVRVLFLCTETQLGACLLMRPRSRTEIVRDTLRIEKYRSPVLRHRLTDRQRRGTAYYLTIGLLDLCRTFETWISLILKRDTGWKSGLHLRRQNSYKLLIPRELAERVGFEADWKRQIKYLVPTQTAFLVSLNRPIGQSSVVN